MPKKYYYGGFRLTKKTAATLTVRELGTAKGLEREPGMPEGYYHIAFGGLEVLINPDANTSGLIQLRVHMGTGERITKFFQHDTLEENFEEEEIYYRAKHREFLKDWIERVGPDKCHAEIDRLWRREGGY